MRCTDLGRWLGAVGLLFASAAPAQTLQQLRATTIETAPPAQVAQAEQLLQRLRDALQRCDGEALLPLLPSWETRVLPAIAFDALHDTSDGQVAGLSRDQLVLSPYGRAVLSLRAQGPDPARQPSPAAALSAWCQGNQDMLAAVLRELQVDRWRWLRQDELELLSGCLQPPVGDGRFSLVGRQGQWQFALLETVESLVGEALAGPDAAPRAALLEARRNFLDRFKLWPPAPLPADDEARNQVLLGTVEEDPELDRFATMIEQQAALPSCR
ncbi:MAG: hypothetical protein R3F15_11515 [Lysobacterales bacterium]